MRANFELLWMLAEHLALTALPGVAAMLFASRRGLRSIPLLLGVAIVASGGTAILAFWAYYATPLLGRAFAFLIVLGSIPAIVVLWRRGVDRGLLYELATPTALWALGSAFVLYLGFLHGGTDQPLSTALTRFSHKLPTDNEIPRYFADYFYAHGHHGTPPLFADWLLSDRPPLQIGYVLAQRPFGWDSAGLHYEVLGLVVQQLWIFGLWALLCAARLTPRTRGLVASAAIVSDVGIVHAFFVWPKLIAAAFMLAALAMIVSDDWPRLRRNPLAGALFAALCGLAMLAHGSSAFFILPLLVFAALRGMPSPAWIGVAIAAGVVLLAPWNAYQRDADPPGNRLIKWQLGGLVEIDQRGALETIADSYREAGVDGTLENKWANVTQIVGKGEAESAVREAVDEVSAGNPGKAIMALRWPRFFDLLPFLGLLLIGPLAMLVTRVRGRPEGPDWRFAVTGLAFCALACLFWVLLMFGNAPARTVIHQGSLAVPLLAVCACVAGACAVHPRLGAGLAIANVALVLFLYVPALTPPAGTSYSAVAALLAAASFAAVAFLTLWPVGVRPFRT
jgi:hypothetical protein